MIEPAKPSSQLQVLLVGAGVVGRAIALDHLLAGIPVWMADRDLSTLSESCDWVLQRSNSTAESASPWGARIDLPIVCIRPTELISMESPDVPQWLVIESIAEKLEIKQAFFADAETWFDRAPILTTNTSTLSINQIASSMTSPERLCGLHFFMPVVDRHAAEIIPNINTAPDVTQACQQHAQRLSKSPLLVADGPGFVVNRMLSPYLNLAMSLLCEGVSADIIEQAARRYGMPMSPLSLVDLIGPRTAFDGGRIVWQAFPQRMDPSPLLPAIVKRKIPGVSGGNGFFTYDSKGNRVGNALTAEVTELTQRYHRNSFPMENRSDTEIAERVAELFAAVMRLEAIAIERDGIADAPTIDAAMRGGLGWRSDEKFPEDIDPNSIDSSGVWPNESWSSNETPITCISEQRVTQLATEHPNIKSVQPLI
ncbi:3-hydroxyacyl-CoA dehydrogenase / enoyl-CoA hydratase / 3-hydroxybutyryl-CoA epimerase/3-hydroxyacyl-CoA dehydrogenase / enoyl-CoA hydratase / 3-hydroxybutyryl-CoA epimerase / enoyl-CoA isomerase [Neorhodopirellula lusitana]|uniref:3-hydroxyacyl-CoA dehydrogenase / enoyl-CoA hydratase / 3-hydroxybutyryl-CoA epimerase/3-hydroxyacyl-CoA dehydrogenase / enoyl-CoA hydratase / 3-hydroxybutyryl-CoA epimerase / enoyl-CoA isomerase n=1 Tax=Neorhodopirellula lusitana TaxID=445327 RepID=A0ABY1PMT3_9BACT|nr:3-hydroxyacyl-CoA dehydrogenase family protein [Neorhodopirellula lusitana]SMP37930.1 3-hydroxyacyl-CoA dehydrogenase / enoyl-CoA hydratase / 3-hydroxybutyryl-CoA epimerase/3-hydroxyacyl-CoA dehydrogenase / enoyl-CoA hydratase / 3-hydroxybutyryl-CoA epimerase / enoyl-CoA isomerase [Neorhodopirellula lusitana]